MRNLLLTLATTATLLVGGLAWTGHRRGSPPLARRYSLLSVAPASRYDRPYYGPSYYSRALLRSAALRQLSVPLFVGRRAIYGRAAVHRVDSPSHNMGTSRARECRYRSSRCRIDDGFSCHDACATDRKTHFCRSNVLRR